MNQSLENVENKRNIKLIIEYDGTNFSGWQTQNNALAVQDVVTKAINSLTGEDIKLIGASRTDAGVHAFGQTANFFTGSRIPPDKFCFALNDILPDDIVIKDSSLVNDDFHSRFSAKGKKYIYKIYNSRFPSAIFRSKAYHVSSKLDLLDMEDAAKYLIGTHNFEAFRASGCVAKSPIRTVNDIKISRNGEFIDIEVVGESFLYNMVRIISGTILYVGIGKIKVKEILEIISSQNRRLAGKTLPSCGLYLCKIFY